MGGSASRATASVGTEILNTATQKTYQNCVNVNNTSNDASIVALKGSSVSGIRQSATATIDASCVSQNVQNADFENNVRIAAENALKGQDEFMSRWMSVDATDVRSNITNKISNVFEVIQQQDCIQQVSAGNELKIIASDGSSVTDVAQTAVAKTLTDCVLGSQQGAKATGTVASQLQQHADISSKGPLSILSDLGKNFLYMAVIGFIAFVILSYITARYGKKGADGKMHNPLVDDVKAQSEGATDKLKSVAKKAEILAL
jgi:hypothetical protein